MQRSGSAFALHVKGPGFDPRHLHVCFGAWPARRSQNCMQWLFELNTVGLRRIPIQQEYHDWNLSFLQPLRLINKHVYGLRVEIQTCMHASHMQAPQNMWQRWDSNPRLRRDWCLKPAPQTARPRYQVTKASLKIVLAFDHTKLIGKDADHTLAKDADWTKRDQRLQNGTGDYKLCVQTFQCCKFANLYTQNLWQRWDSNPRLRDASMTIWVGVTHQPV